MSDRLPDGVYVISALIGATLFKHAFAVWSHARYERNKFKKVGTVKELMVWPVKSLGGFQTNFVMCTKAGVSYEGVTDRHWAVSTDENIWITQRDLPRMALISTTLTGDTITLDAPGMEPLLVPINPKVDPNRISKIKIKFDWADSLDCGDKAAAWLSSFLKMAGLRMHFSPSSFKKRDAINAVKNWEHDAKEGDLTAFSDYCGYMLMTSSSLDDVNKRLKEPVTMLNFRPNIIVEGSPPYAEDQWGEVKIGKACFRNIDACTRCILTTVDPFKGEKSKDMEPLATLKKYRLRPPYGEKPCLGIHLALDSEDTIRIGDDVYASMKQS